MADTPGIFALAAGDEVNTASWLIVGGGLHGVHLAVRLLTDARVPREKLKILDPAPSLLARWRERSSATGMHFMRSPSVHHLDREALSLLRFTGKSGKKRRRMKGQFAQPYGRPSLDLFNQHCDALVVGYGLADCHVRGSATSIKLEPQNATVTTGRGEHLVTQHVILAMGVDEHAAVPPWASGGDSRIHHIFDSGAAHLNPERDLRVAIIGGGISAIQRALREIRGGQRVVLICRHELKKHQFDSDPGWLGPKLMHVFEKQASMAERRSIIEGARHRGSIPPELFADLQIARDRGQIDVRIDEVKAVSDQGSTLRLELEKSEGFSADRVLLATGFSSRRPGGELVDRLIESHGLACADCGFPIVDCNLRWHPRVLVTGALAELELGPSARNISGARRAGERIVSWATRDRSSFVRAEGSDAFAANCVVG